MSDIATPLLEWLNANPELAGLATFLISAGESVAIIGTIVPGSIMMTAIGALVGAGIIPFWPTLTWAILGAIVGDGISYWFGHYFKDRMHNIWPFEKHPNLLASGEKFFHRHGAMSVFIGRFVGPVRALVPLVAGMLGLKPLRFTIANICSAILWAPIYMLPGFLLGAASMELPSELAARVLMLLILGALALILCIWLIKKIFDLIKQEIDQFLNWIWNSLKKSRYFNLLTVLLKHYNPKNTHGQLTLAFYFIFTSLAFLYLANFILYKGSSGGTNSMIYHFFRSLRTLDIDNSMLLLSLLGDKFVLFPLVATLFAWFIYTKNWHTAIHLLALGLIAGFSIEGFKHVVHSARPWGTLGNSDAGYSFPSGHATLSATFYVGLALLFIKICKIKLKNAIYIPVGILIIMIGVSRLYFGVHWLTDIIGGWLLASSILMLIILSYNRKSDKPIKPRGVILTTAITLVLSYGIYAYTSFNKLKHDYTFIDSPLYTITFDSWWQQKGGYFPLYRVNRLGISSNVFNVQWLGNINEVKSILLKNGWNSPSKNDWLSVMYRITGIESTQHLPLLSPLYLDKHPALILVKQTDESKKLVILRFWASQFLINNVQEPLWLGTIEYAPSTYSWLFKNKQKNAISPTSALMFDAMPKSYSIKETTVSVKIDRRIKNQNLLLIKPKKINSSHNSIGNSTIDTNSINFTLMKDGSIDAAVNKYSAAQNNPSLLDEYDYLG
jgi:membrane protein DedA with SNARE-associated domain/membrane-associated phospholipid phosphatase